MSIPPPAPTTRDVFPRLDDRTVIRAFLAGKSRTRNASPNAIVEIRDGLLAFTSGPTIAWYDTSGALCAKLSPGGRERPASRLAINFIMDMMGQSARHVEAEPVGLTTPVDSVNRWRFFFDGAPVAIDQPIVLVGPLGVIAYRATLSKFSHLQEY